MINLSVDECYAFDYLAILKVKNQKYPSTEAEFAIVDCCFNLFQQIGMSKVHRVLDSQEFEDLEEANRKTFDAVELARYGEITAKEVDDCNMERYNAKVALQKRFFPESKQVETKS